MSNADRADHPHGCVSALIVAFLYGVVTLALVRDLVPVVATHLYSDLGDPLLNAAILGWNAEHLPLTSAWWNFPAFAPLSGVMAFSEHLLLSYPLASPIIWMTGNPILAYNIIFIVAWWLNALAGYALGLTLTKSPESAFVGGLALAFAPFNSVHIPHLQLLLAFGMPMVLVGLHRYVLENGRSGLLLIGAGWLAVGLSNVYMLAFSPLFVAGWMVWFVRPDNWRRAVSALVVLAIASVPLIPLLYGYAMRHAAYGLTRPYDEVLRFSADIGGSIGISQYATTWRFILPATFQEASLFPGAMIVALGMTALFAARSSLRRAAASDTLTLRSSNSFVARVTLAGLISAAIAALRFWTGPFSWHIGILPLPPFEPSRLFMLSSVCLLVGVLSSRWMRTAWRTRNTVIFFAMGVVGFWLLAIGPEPTFHHYRALAYGPYRGFLWLPFTRSIRVVARAWQPATVCLAVLGACGTDVLLQKWPSRRIVILTMVSAAIVAEGWWASPVVAGPSRMVKDLIPQNALVLDLPAAARADLNASAQYRAVLGGYRTLNGYSGYIPGFFIRLIDLTEDRNRTLFDDYRILDDLYVIVRAQMREEDTDWVAGQPGAQLVFSTNDWDLYRLPASGDTRAPIPLPLPSRLRPQFRLH